MTAKEKTVWGIHAGRTGEAHTLFTKEKVVALGWNEMPDLSTLPADREAYKTAMAKAYPAMSPGAVPGSAGQLFRFANEMQVGDFVVYPSKSDRRIHLARVEGAYFHVPSPEHDYAHRRKVAWLKDVPRTVFTQGALYEIGSALSFFQVRNYAEEFLAVLEGKPLAGADEKDTTVGVVAEQIESTTRDFIIKELSRELKGHPFTHFVANLLRAMGFRTRVSPEGPDSGIDIVAHRDELGLEPPIIKVQVKSGGGNVGEPEVSQLFGKIEKGEYGLFVTLSAFTPQARRFAATKANLRLIDGNELVDVTLDHYEQLEARHKGLLPLKRVFIPETIEKPTD